MYKALIVAAITFFSIDGIAQRNSRSLSTNKEGSFFISGGYNRSTYAATTVELRGSDHALTLENVALADNPGEASLLNFFGSDAPQFSLQGGYFVADKWAIIADFHRYNTFFVNEQTVSISGNVAPNAHPEFSGNYNNESTALTRDQIHLVQKNGMHLITLGVQRMDQLVSSRDKNASIHSVLEGKVGPVVSGVDYTFGNAQYNRVTSLSGWNAAFAAGLRFDFFQRIYLLTRFSGGHAAQNNIRLSNNGKNTAAQNPFYFAAELSAGITFSTSSGSKCSTCPDW